ncbi:hypothetical protein, conserved [Eimeria brunetti]|uniref:Uncharacterized protein n=1 Tax=Eimeria brunetti TaxID=51314 RepID=U6LF52_9EIME|nr:hypothetical protein, conserved [Eimeria brunetti]
MTAPPQFSLDLAEIAPAWPAAVAPPAEALQPFFASPSPSSISEFGVYEDVARASFPYFGRVPSAGPPPRSRFLLVAAIASISAVAFLLLRCFALLSAESPSRVSGSLSRRLADDDDVFSCGSPSEQQAGEGASTAGSRWHELGRAPATGIAFFESVHPTVRQQLEMLDLTRAEAEVLTLEEQHLVANAQASMRRLISRFQYLRDRVAELSRRETGLKREKAAAGKVEEGGEEDDEEEAVSISSQLMSVEKELMLERQELHSIQTKLDKIRFTSDQNVMSLLMRAQIFATGRYISAAASQALMAQKVVLGEESRKPVQPTKEQMTHVGLLVTDILLRSSSCRGELQRVHQHSLQLGHSAQTAAAIAAPIAQKARILLSDLKVTLMQMQEAHMQPREDDVVREIEQMTKALEAGGFMSTRGSPRTSKRLYGPDAFTTIEGKSPLYLWRAGTTSRQPWQRSPSADIYLSSEHLREESSSTAASSGQLVADLQGPVKLTASSRSVEDTRPRPRQSYARIPDASTTWPGSTGTWGVRLWRSSPEIFTNLLGLHSTGESQKAEATAAPRETIWGSGSAASSGWEDDSEESSDASFEQLQETFWLTGSLPLSSGGDEWLPGPVRKEDAEATTRRALRELKVWTGKAEGLLQEEVTSYAVFEKLKYHMTRGQSLLESLRPYKEDTGAALMDSILLQDLRQRFRHCEVLLQQVEERVVERALKVLSDSEGSLKDSMQSLRQGVERATASDLNRILFERILMRVASDIQKTQPAHTRYSGLLKQIPGAAARLKKALRRLAKRSFETASLLVTASDQAQPLEAQEDGRPSSTRRPSSDKQQQQQQQQQQGPAATSPQPPLRSTGSIRSSAARREVDMDVLLKKEDPSDDGAALIAAAAEKASSVLQRLNLE